MKLQNFQPRLGIQYFWLSLLLLAGVEVMLVSLFTDARAILSANTAGTLLSNAGILLKWVICASAIFFLFVSKNLAHASAILGEKVTTRRYIWVLPLHGFCFLAFFGTTLVIFNSSSDTGLIHLVTWTTLTAIYATSFALLISSPKNLSVFFRVQRLPLLISAVGAVLIVSASLYTQLLWSPLSSFTMHGSHFLLNFLYSDIYIDAGEKLLGANNFIVHIAPQCSGIEGMTLAAGITGAYLFFSRDQLSFPRAYLLIPIAILLALLFNLLRVAALIAIGASVSEELAIEGFHSVAGWISSVLIALLIIFGFSSWSQFQKEHTELPEPDDRAITEANLATAILIPFVLFMAATLIAGIFKSDFDYLYPVKLLLPLAALIFFFRRYELKASSKIVDPIAIGFLVAILWAIVVPANAEANETFSEHLFSMPVWAIALWGFARMLGFWLFAPIAEELVFRCYLINRLTGVDLRTDGKIPFSVIAFLVSSILFGLLHADWLAGTIAGAFFAIARYRSDSLTSPIIAHASANIFVGIWAVYSQNWILL